MQDNIGIVIAMLIFVLFAIMFPLYNLFERQDDMSYTLVLKAASNFIEEVRNNGYIDQSVYDNLMTQLSSTGNSYDVQIEAHRKILIKEEDDYGHETGKYIEQYKIDYNNDIFTQIETANASGTTQNTIKNNTYLMNQDDKVYIRIKNVNQTMAQSIFNSIVTTASKERIVIDYGGVIRNNAWKKVDATVMPMALKPEKPIITARKSGAAQDLYMDNSVISVEGGINVAFTAKSKPANSYIPIKAYVWTIEYSNGNVESFTLNGITSNTIKAFPNEGTSKIRVYAIDQNNSLSEVTTIIVNSYSEAPTIPILISDPDITANSTITSLAGSATVKFTATSTINSVVKSIAKYVYSVQNGSGTPVIYNQTNGILQINFADGINTVKVYAEDTAGIRSEEVTVRFLVVKDSASQIITNAGIRSITTELVEGTTISEYSFQAIVRSGGLTGNDFYRITGLTLNDTWENINPTGVYNTYISVTNGVTLSNIVLTDASKYKQIKFEYYVDTSNSSGLSSSSKISYKVKYLF